MYYLHLVYGPIGMSSTTDRLYGVIMLSVRRPVIPATVRVDGPWHTVGGAMVRARAEHAIVIGG